MARRLNPLEWPIIVQIGAACGVIGSVGGAISVVTPAYTAADPIQIANHQYVNEQVTAGAKQVIDALVPRLDAMQVTINARGDAIASIAPRLNALQDTVMGLQDTVVGLGGDLSEQTAENLRTRITATRLSIISLTGQLNELNAPLADYPHNVALQAQQKAISDQLTAMNSALKAAVCDLNKRINASYVCPN